MTTDTDPAAVAAEYRQRATDCTKLATACRDMLRETSSRVPGDIRAGLEHAIGRNEALAAEYGRVASALEAAAARIAALERLEWFARKVVENFRASEAQGYRSRERQYAIDMLGRCLPPLPEKEGSDA